MPHEPVNLNRLMNDFGDDPKFLTEIYSAYLEDGTERTKLLAEAVANQDAEKCSECAHAIKGASANVGAERVRAAADQLERDANAGDLSRASEILDTLLKEFEEVRSFLTKFLTTLTP